MPAWTLGNWGARTTVINGPEIPRGEAVDVVRADIYQRVVEALWVAQWGRDGRCPVCSGFKDVEPHEPDCEVAFALRGGQ
jgi:hypothetical protein